MNATQVAAAKTAELVAFFNANSAKPVQKFADRKTAERRVLALIAEVEAKMAAVRPAAASAPADRKAAILARVKAKTAAPAYVRGHCPKCGSSADITTGRVVDRKDGQVVINGHEADCHSCGHRFNYDTGATLRKSSKVANPEGRAAAIAASWARPEVLAARTTRHAVLVDGVKCRSVLAAFEALGLPTGEHIRFRGQLKAAGRAEAYGRVWTLVAAEAE